MAKKAKKQDEVVATPVENATEQVTVENTSVENTSVDSPVEDSISILEESAGIVTDSEPEVLTSESEVEVEAELGNDEPKVEAIVEEKPKLDEVDKLINSIQNVRFRIFFRDVLVTSNSSSPKIVKKDSNYVYINEMVYPINGLKVVLF